VSYGKFFLRAEDVDLVFMGPRESAVQEAHRIAKEHDTAIEVWPDPENEDYTPLAVCVALPPVPA
jgi:broad specificity phosphatase PhoE